MLEDELELLDDEELDELLDEELEDELEELLEDELEEELDEELLEDELEELGGHHRHHGENQRRIEANDLLHHFRRSTT